MRLCFALSFLVCVSTWANPLEGCELEALAGLVPQVGLRYLKGHEERAPIFAGVNGIDYSPSDLPALAFDVPHRDLFFAQLPAVTLRNLLDPKIFISSQGGLHLLSRDDSASFSGRHRSLAVAFDRKGSVTSLRHIIYEAPFEAVSGHAPSLISGERKNVQLEFFDFGPEGQMQARGDLGHHLWIGGNDESSLKQSTSAKPWPKKRSLNGNFDWPAQCPLVDSLSDVNALHAQMYEYMVLDLAEAQLNELSPTTLSTYGCATCLGVGLATPGRVLVAHIPSPPAGGVEPLLEYWLNTFFGGAEAVERPSLRIVGDGFGAKHRLGQQMIGAAMRLGVRVDEVDIGQNIGKGLGYSFDQKQRRFVPFRCDFHEK